MSVFVKRTRLDASADEVFAWHTRPGAFSRLVPPWEPVTLLTPDTGLTEGLRLEIDIPLGPLHQRWVAQVEAIQEGISFRDIQVSGPFAHWVHTHRFEPDGPDACYLEDRIEYTLPLAPLTLAGDPLVVRGKLERMFAYRHRVTQADLAIHKHYQTKKGGSPLKILVSGAHGLVGSALLPFLTTGGHTVHRLVRGKARPNSGDVTWDPAAGTIDKAALEGFDAVIHLAGENIAEGRWTEEKKAKIRDSRVKGTRLLAEALASLENPPKALVCASAIGFYGNRGDESLSEVDAGGKDFLANVCREWEASAQPAAEKGIRVVNLRFGIILSPKGGALAKMLPIFQLGQGGPLGSGKQFMSWVALDDVIGTIHHAIMTDTLRGPVNVVAPNPVRNSEYTCVMGKVLFRPALVPGIFAAVGLKVLFGEMANALLLSSTRVEPVRLLETGYQFQYPTLEGALRHLLGK